MSEQKKKEAGKLEIQLDDDVAQGNYANLAIVDHSDAEFVLDFIFVQPQAPRGKVRSRVVLAPRNAKRLLMVLQDNVAKYEEKFGTIESDNLQPPRKEGEYH